MRRERCGKLLAVAALAMALNACTAFLARQIERPGRVSAKQSMPLRQMLEYAGMRYEAMRTGQGVRIAYWYGRPRAYAFKATLREERHGRHLAFSFRYHFKSPKQAAPLPARGSVVLLHPWGTEGSAMAGWGLAFAGAGYIVVMPDLRSQGSSGDAPVGYGPREAGDIVALVHDLEASGRLPAPVYLLGASYGATVALFAAPRLPEVRGVVALEPYADAVDVIHRAPSSGLFGYRWLARWITPHELDAAIARADRKLGIDLAAIDPGAALAQAKACTLILGGSRDVLIPPASLQRLAQRSPEARYVEVAGEGHLTLPLRTDRLFPPIRTWIDALPAAPGNGCPGFTPLPATPEAGRSRMAAPGAPLRPRPPTASPAARTSG